MRTVRYLGGTLGAVLLVWALFTWPLPRYFSQGIPSSSQNVERGGVRTMILGDHLQLLYHFQLVEDFLTGRAPWFHNLYEFNVGDDSERKMPGSYFAPFSLPYVAFAVVMTDAAAWNLVSFLTIWLTFIATMAYVRRFTPLTPTAAAFGALISILLPYRWVSLLGGSPSGFAMVFTPLAALGFDGIARTGRLRDGWLAGAALFLACWGDLHVFFFATISLPLWMGLAALDTNLLPRLRWPLIRARIPAMVAALSGLVAAAVYRAARHAHLAESEMGDGRSEFEVRGFSPSIRGFWGWAGSGLQSHVYLGLTVALILAAAFWVLLARHADDRRRHARSAVIVLAVIAVFGILTLALGMQGPLNGLALRAMRVLIPPYSMIRQTAKIFVLLPTLLALLAGLSLNHLKHRIPASTRSRYFAVIVVILTLGVLAEYKAQVRTTVCLLEPEQSAYAAVARDAGERLETAHALVIPIWPGEAAEASVYQFHARQYGIRLVNGYSPVVSRRYLETVFEPLQVVNQGVLTQVEIDLLESMGIRYLILHEDMFPEKVSPFPVTLTRDRLMGHPKLSLLASDGAVWSFRIEPRERYPLPDVRQPTVRFPTRQIRFEHRGPEDDRIPDPDCAGGAYLVLRDTAVEAPGGRSWKVASDPQLAWYLRVRGQGVVGARTIWADEMLDETTATIDSKDWIWVRLPLADLPAYGPVRGAFRAIEGEIHADMGFLILGGWDPILRPGETRSFEPADFFHAGYSEWTSQDVVFRPERDPEAAVFYGPRLPLAAGRYRLNWDIASQAPEGTVLGRINVRHDDVDAGNWIFVYAGSHLSIEWDQPGNLPVTWVLVYHRTGDLRIRGLQLERLY